MSYCRLFIMALFVVEGYYHRKRRRRRRPGKSIGRVDTILIARLNQLEQALCCLCSLKEPQPDVQQCLLSECRCTGWPSSNGLLVSKCPGSESDGLSYRGHAWKMKIHRVLLAWALLKLCFAGFMAQRTSRILHWNISLRLSSVSITSSVVDDWCIRFTCELNAY